MVDSRLREEIYKMTLEHVVGTESKYGLKKKKKKTKAHHQQTNKQMNNKKKACIDVDMSEVRGI